MKRVVLATTHHMHGSAGASYRGGETSNQASITCMESSLVGERIRLKYSYWNNKLTHWRVPKIF
jgi:hypothetical protein